MRTECARSCSCSQWRQLPQQVRQRARQPSPDRTSARAARVRSPRSPRMTVPCRGRLRPRCPIRRWVSMIVPFLGRPRPPSRSSGSTTGRFHGPLPSTYRAWRPTTGRCHGPLRSKRRAWRLTTGRCHGPLRSKRRAWRPTTGRYLGRRRLQLLVQVSLRTTGQYLGPPRRLKPLLPARCRIQGSPGPRPRQRRRFWPVCSLWRSPARSSSSAAGAGSVRARRKPWDERSDASMRGGAPLNLLRHLQTPYPHCPKR
jgi:hypothetical protein